MVKISVIIPIYNMEKYVRECLDSILTQSLKELEIICIDDGSTDNSYNILMEYCVKYDYITLIHQKNQGAGLARNRGIAIAGGKYVAFMDPDDYYANNRVLETLYYHAEKNNVLICGGNVAQYYENGEIMRREDWFDENKRMSFRDYAYFQNYTCYIFNLEFLRENQILFPPYRRYQDPPFLMNVMTHIKEFYAINEVVYMYRVGHKKLTFTPSVVVDVLRGLRDCFQMAANANFVKVYSEHLKFFLRSYLTHFYPCLIQGNQEAWDVISEINEISLKWMGECDDIFLDREHMEKFISGIREKRKNMLSECRIKETVIYGAGTVGKRFLEKYRGDCRKIVGFAVSNPSSKEESVAGYKIKNIKEYNRDMFVVVAVSEKYSDEILRNLKALKFQNICYIKPSELKYIEIIDENAESQEFN